MPVPLKPRVYKCLSCNWQKKVTNQSDALIEGITGFTICPECENEDIQVEWLHNPIDEVLSSIKTIFE